MEGEKEIERGSERRRARDPTRVSHIEVEPPLSSTDPLGSRGFGSTGVGSWVRFFGEITH